ncbi:MAG TPA: glucose-6-phosphate isomerase family protein [Streptosporangiaceae bacterium]|nr:glucose-6-phosphate isomerase family protein [Streptosporangiaceae bacterium]
MLDFDSGVLAPAAGEFTRRLSDMAGAYADSEAVRSLLAHDDPVMYAGYDASVPPEAGHLTFRTTIVMPGTIGSEYFMTKGHHHIRDSAEFYLGMSGTGLLLMQSRSGDFAQQDLEPRASIYVPPGWAHRTINTGNVPLIFLAVYFGDAGHDYESVADVGFGWRVFRGAAGPELRAEAVDGA